MRGFPLSRRTAGGGQWQWPWQWQWWRMVLAAMVLSQMADAQLLVSKQYSRGPLIQGVPFTVTYHLQNDSTETLRNLELVELTFSIKGFSVVEGSFRLKADTLPPLSKDTFHVTAIAETAGPFVDQPAMVRFQRPKHPSNSGDPVDLVTASVISSARGAMYVITAEEFVVHHQPHPKEWLLFMAIAVLLVGWPSLRYRALRRTTKSLAHR